MTYDPSRIETAERQRDILRAMSATLADQVAALEAAARTTRVRTFVEYKRVRERYQEARDLIETMADRHPAVRDHFPADFMRTLVGRRLRIVAAYTALAHAFFRDPPDSVSRALGAHEVLSAERDAFRRVLEYFDQMLMEAALDDAASQELEETRVRIEAILATLDRLLLESPTPLEEFG